MRRRIFRSLAPIAVLLLGCGTSQALAVGAGAPAVGRLSPAAVQAEGVPALGPVFLIIGENTTYSHLTTTNAPYLMNTIRPRAAWLSNYYAATHWSQANYVAMVTGQFTRCEQQDYGTSCHQNVDNLCHQMDVAGLTWKVWLEAGSAKCDTGSGGSCASNTACPLTGFYTTGNPPILFDDIEGPNGVWSATTPSAECLANDVPAGTPTSGMATFNADLASGQIASFNTVIPNGCEDGEANCKPVNNRYTQFDNFLRAEVPKIAARNGLGSGGHVLCAILSPLAVPGSYGQKYYHYSVLRTLEDGFGITSYLGDANEVSPINNVWHR